MCKEKMTTCKILANVVFSAAFLTPPLSLFWRPQNLVAKVEGPTRNGMGESNLKKRGDGMYLLATCPPVLPAAAYHEPRQEYTTGPLCPAQLESQKCS